jgi:sec-independent protein translocase protein TatA
MPFGLQPIHLVVIAVVALLIFGPSRLPEIGRGVAKALIEFRKGFGEMSGNFMGEINKVERGDVPQNSIQTEKKEPASQIMNTCPHCGENNPGQANYCNSCGTRLSEP